MNRFKSFIINFFIILPVLFVSCEKMNLEPQEKIGVVLAGGGAKGAYQVGAWKALEEYGVTKNVSVISGTSVGALNAALFACTDIETQEGIWLNDVGFDTFMAPDEESLMKISEMILDAGIEASKKDGNSLKNFGMEVLGKIGKDVLDYALSDNHASGLFDRSPLIKIIEDNISLKKLNNRCINVYATAVQKNSLALQMISVKEGNLMRFLLNEQINDENIKDILLASSALPGVYPSQTLKKSVVVDGKELGQNLEFVDGGFVDAGGDNTPVASVLAEEGIDKIFVIYLSHNASVRSFDQDEPQVINIIPTMDLGSKYGSTVNFSKDQIKKLVDLGYKDACEVLEANGYKKIK